MPFEHTSLVEGYCTAEEALQRERSSRMERLYCAIGPFLAVNMCDAGTTKVIILNQRCNEETQKPQGKTGLLSGWPDIVLP